jgi:hypothetical protein
VVVKVMTDRSVAKPNKDPVFDIVNIKKDMAKIQSHLLLQKNKV